MRLELLEVSGELVEHGIGYGDGSTVRPNASPGRISVPARRITRDLSFHSPCKSCGWRGAGGEWQPPPGMNIAPVT
jgi:hypothetical protein